MDKAGSIDTRRIGSAESFSDGLVQWRGVLKVGGWAALASVVLTFVQVWIYVQWPPPETVEGFYGLFAERPFLGLLSMDLLYIVNNTIVLLVYLAIFAVLRRAYPSTVTIGLLMGAMGMAAYMASNTSFEMLSLANAYATADTAGQIGLIGAGEAMLAVFEGTAFDIYYVLSAVALFLFAASMLRSRLFSRAAGFWGLAAAVLMVVPSTAGTVGMVFALGSLIPWVVFSVLTGRQLLHFGSAGRASGAGR
jgi:hypothetical protein